MIDSTYAQYLPQKFAAVLGIAAVVFFTDGCSHFNDREQAAEDMSPQDRAAATRIDTREAQGKLTATDAAMRKDSLVHSVKF